MLCVRDAIVRMKPYHPPVNGRSGLRLDFNENLAGCSPRVLAALSSLTPDILATYPERGPVERRVAEFLHLDPAQTLLTNGVDEAIHLICGAYLEAGTEALIATPTFGMYEVYAAQTGAEVVRVQAREDFAFPLENMLAAISVRTRVVLIANPNNPTGQAVSECHLISILRAAPSAAVLVDEAYYDFHGFSLLSRLHEFPNLLVARTFSKAFGMAGLRVGVLCGDPIQVQLIRKIVSAYNVNIAALTVLGAALAERDYVTSYVAEVREQRERVSAALKDIGIHYWPSAGNFVLCRIGARSAEFCAALRSLGVLVRDRSTDPGCDGCVRITIGMRSQMDRLLAELPKVLDQLGLQARNEVSA